MDFHVAMETFAEVWMTANMQNYSHTGADTSDPEVPKQRSSEMSNVVEETVSDGWNSPKLPNRTGVTKLSPSLPLPIATTASTPLSGVRSYPIRCLVEEENQDSNGNVLIELSTTVLCDTFAILPGSLLFSDILRGALVKIGFSVLEAIGAKGTVQIRNWKPLPFEVITDNPDCTVEEILGDISSAATLRIRLSRVDLDRMEWTDHAVRCAVVKLLKELNQKSLAKICPLPQSMISNIANSKYSARICTEKCQEFGKWYKEYHREHKPSLSEPRCGFGSTSPHSRMTFHPIYELPMMRDWYRNNKNPSAEEFKRFLDELNRLPVRQERSKVPLRRLKIWWCNEKQRLKRQHQKEVDRSQVAPNQDSVNGSGTPKTNMQADRKLPKSGRGTRADGLLRKTRERKHFRRHLTLETSTSVADFSTREPVGPSSSCFLSNANKTFASTEMTVPAGSSLHRPVYVNSPSDVGFHVRYLEDRPRSRNDCIVPYISSRGHLPLVGLSLQQQGLGAMNQNVYHLPDNLYSPIFHSCSVSNSSHASP